MGSKEMEIVVSEVCCVRIANEVERGRKRLLERRGFDERVIGVDN